MAFGLTPPSAGEYCENVRRTEIDFPTKHSPWQGWCLALTEKSLLWETNHPFIDMLAWFVKY